MRTINRYTVTQAFATTERRMQEKGLTQEEQEIARMGAIDFFACLRVICREATRQKGHERKHKTGMDVKAEE